MRKLQQRVDKWLRMTFDNATADDPRQRALRFLEEAIELVQATGTIDEEEAQGMVNYVYNRPKGDIRQEIAGTTFCLLGLANVYSVNVKWALSEELRRVSFPRVYQAIREKWRNKPEGVKE